MADDMPSRVADQRRMGDSGPVRTRELFILAAAMGLAEGYLELLALAVRRLAHPMLSLGRDTIWLAPVGNLLLFLLAAIPIAILIAHIRKRAPFRPVVGALIACGCFATLTIPGTLSRAAVLVLAVGLGIRLSHVLSRHQSLTLRVGRVAFPILAGLTISLGLGLHGVLRWREWRAETSLPAAQTGVPNVVLIVLDAVRAQSLGLYGALSPTTPSLEAWAAGGVVFDRAIATSSWTLPSHASMFTGRDADELNANWETPLDKRFPTLAEVLGSHGYYTAGFVGNVGNCSFEGGLSRGFQHYEDYRVSWGTLGKSSALVRLVVENWRFRRLFGWYEDLGRKAAPGITESLLKWIDGHRDRPFFAFANFYDAHSPYLPPKDLLNRFGGAQERQDPLLASNTIWTAHGIAAERSAYEASIAAIDRSLGVLFAELEKRGLKDKTLVILTGDHGEEFGEHGEMTHGRNLFMTTVHVPLVLLWPGHLPAGSRIQEVVSLRRIAPTVEDLAGLGATNLPGRSLRPFWDSSERDSSSSADRWAVSLLRRNPGAPVTWRSSMGDQVALTGDSLRVLTDTQDSVQVYETTGDTREVVALKRPPVQVRAEADSILGVIRLRADSIGKPLSSAREVR